MTNWLIKYIKDNKEKWCVYRAKHTMEAKELFFKNVINVTDIISIEVFSLDLLSEDQIKEIRMKVISLV